MTPAQLAKDTAEKIHRQRLCLKDTAPLFISDHETIYQIAQLIQSALDQRDKEGASVDAIQIDQRLEAIQEALCEGKIEQTNMDDLASLRATLLRKDIQAFYRDKEAMNLLKRTSKGLHARVFWNDALMEEIDAFLGERNPKNKG